MRTSPSPQLPADCLGLPALSIRPLWAHAVVHLGKDIENRSWGTKFRGRFLIHAGLGQWNTDRKSFVQHACARIPEVQQWWESHMFGPAFGPVQRGGIIGVAELVDCVDAAGQISMAATSSPWWIGPYGFILRNVRPIAHVPCPGKLGFFKPCIPSALV